MKAIDKDFYDLIWELKNLSFTEIYHRIRKSFESVPAVTRKSCADFFNRFGYWGKLDESKGIYEQIELKAKVLSAHADDFACLYERLGDYRSKKTLFSILSNWYRYDFKTTAETKEYLFDDYFDLDLVRCDENEVIADLGAYTGDTVLSYIKNYGEDCYKKIYCYEITPSVFARLKENLSNYRNIDCRNKGVADKEGKMNIAVNTVSASANVLSEENGDVTVTTLDADVKENLTLIKADIEGFEKKALLGAKNHILTSRPKLLISVYHNNDDLWEIPALIDSFRTDYAFYLRYKSSCLYPTEITLFAL